MTAFTDYPELKTLPRLVRRQRRLERRAAKLATAAADEKATRDQIDQLLQAAGFERGQVVTCNGYDVTHNERDGRKSLNADVLLGAGVSPIDIALATEQGPVSRFCTVRPIRGSRVAD